jgi:hypothetical protein
MQFEIKVRPGMGWRAHDHIERRELVPRACFATACYCRRDRVSMGILCSMSTPIISDHMQLNFSFSCCLRFESPGNDLSSMLWWISYGKRPCARGTGACVVRGLVFGSPNITINSQRRIATAVILNFPVEIQPFGASLYRPLISTLHA